MRIKWTDGTIYTCKYLGRKRILLYHIQLDHETRSIQRNEFVLSMTSSSYKSDLTKHEHNYTRRQPISKRKKPKQRTRTKQKRQRSV
jgi:hypothetical protein